MPGSRGRCRWSRPVWSGISPAPVCLGDVVAVLLQDRRHRVELVQRRRQLLLVVVDQARELLRQRRRVGEQFDDRLAALVEHTDEIVAVENQSVHLCAALRQDLGDVRTVLEQCAQRVVSVVDGLRQLGDAVERRTELWRNLIQRLRQRVQRLVERSGVGARGVRRELADRLGERVRRSGARYRDDVHGVHRAVAGGLQREHAFTEKRSGSHVCRRVRPEFDRAVDRERHHGVASL